MDIPMLYKLKLHQSLEVGVNARFVATRVPGGWIYERKDPQTNLVGLVFVPFNTEYESGIEL